MFTWLDPTLGAIYNQLIKLRLAAKLITPRACPHYDEAGGTSDENAIFLIDCGIRRSDFTHPIEVVQFQRTRRMRRKILVMTA